MGQPNKKFIANADFPPVKRELIVALRTRFKYDRPAPDGNERDDLFRAGQESVLEWLEMISESQLQR
jgi:hypothetical protein